MNNIQETLKEIQLSEELADDIFSMYILAQSEERTSDINKYAVKSL